MDNADHSTEFVSLAAQSAAAWLLGLNKASNIVEVLAYGKEAADKDNLKDAHAVIRKTFFDLVHEKPVNASEVLAVAFTVLCGIAEGSNAGIIENVIKKGNETEDIA